MRDLSPLLKNKAFAASEAIEAEAAEGSRLPVISISCNRLKNRITGYQYISSNLIYEAQSANSVIPIFPHLHAFQSSKSR